MDSGIYFNYLHFLMSSLSKYYPNILAISGSGRNVGKTSLLCSIIKRKAENLEITAVKISPHFHYTHYGKSEVEVRNNYVIFSEEDAGKAKDSSKMLASGARTVFYIQAKDDYLEEALDSLLEMIHPGAPIICESGGIQQFIEPGLSFFVTNEPGGALGKSKPKNAVEVVGDLQSFDLLAEQVDFVKGKWVLK